MNSNKRSDYSDDEESYYSNDYDYVLNPFAKEFVPLTLNPSAKEFVPLNPFGFDPFEYNEPQDTEVIIKHPGFTMGVKKSFYHTANKIGKITCEGLVFDIMNYENNVAILSIPNRVYDAFFPLTMSLLQVTNYYFGEKKVIADDSIRIPMKDAPFCNIIVE